MPSVWNAVWSPKRAFAKLVTWRPSAMSDETEPGETDVQAVLVKYDVIVPSPLSTVRPNVIEPVPVPLR